MAVMGKSHPYLMGWLQLRTAGLLRSGLAAFGLLAALTLVLQPVCGAYELLHEADGGTPCCAEMQAEAMAAPVSVEISKGANSAPALVPLAATAFAAAPAPYRFAAWNDPPPPPLSYHARSARILR
jgi:hypothetical protein